jgi:hypothetical protein
MSSEISHPQTVADVSLSVHVEGNSGEGDSPLPIDDFINELEVIRSEAARMVLRGAFGRPPLDGVRDIETAKRPEIVFLIQLGVYPEWRETHLLARQIQRVTDSALLRRVGQQIADEAKHAEVLCGQLRKWGADPKRFYEEPIYEWSASFDYMDKLTDPVEYFATSNFIGEGLFLPTLLAPMAKYDRETFSAYVEHILPDEPSHVRLGRDFIFKFCRGAEMQARVRRHARTVAKQYCLGYHAAVQFAIAAKAGTDPMNLRDRAVLSPQLDANSGADDHATRTYSALMKEFQI